MKRLPAKKPGSPRCAARAPDGGRIWPRPSATALELEIVVEKKKRTGSGGKHCSAGSVQRLHLPESLWRSSEEGWAGACFALPLPNSCWRRLTPSGETLESEIPVQKTLLFAWSAAPTERTSTSSPL